MTRWKESVLAAAALVLAAAAWLRVPPAPQADPAAQARVEARPDSVAAAGGRPGWLADIAPASLPAEPPATLARRLERLGAGSEPMDGYRAWWLVRQCMRYQRNGRLDGQGDGPVEAIAEPAAFCAGMTERMKMSRIDHLERAARAGIEEAAVALVEEGPFGDPSALETRPDDPLVREWKARMGTLLGRNADEGAWTSLYLLFTGFLFENPVAADRQSALAYGMALRDIMVRLDGVAEQDAIPFNGPFLARVGEGLGPEQVAQASARAAAIVERAAARRLREGR